MEGLQMALLTVWTLAVTALTTENVGLLLLINIIEIYEKNIFASFVKYICMNECLIFLNE